MKSYICKNGIVIRPVKKTVKRVQQWHYQVFCPTRGMLPLNPIGRSEADNLKEIEAVGQQNGGGRWL